jgi:hypothetical protein
MAYVRRLFALLFAAAMLAACAAAGGGGASGGGAKATDAPKASAAPSTMPSGNPDVDNYGY